MHQYQSTPGTRGFLLYVKERLPWVYAEYVKRGAAGIINPGMGANDGDGFMGALDITTDISGTTTYFGDDAPSFAAPTTTADPAATAPTSATTPAQASWLSSIAKAAGTFLLAREQSKTQQKIVDLQLQRAQAGLPMLDLSRLESGLPNPQVNFGLSPNTQSTLLMVAALLGGGILVMSMLNRRGRA
jgi:hypothetical protein